MYMVVKAGRIPLLQITRAMPEWIIILDKIKIGGQPRYLRIRPEIVRTIPDDSPCLEDTGKILIRDPYHRIALTILEKDVVVRVVFLYQIVLKDKSLILIACDDVVYGIDLIDKSRCLGIPVGKEI